VGRRRDFRALLPQVLDDRNGKRRALDGVGPRAELVQKHQGMPVGLGKDRDDIFHMRRKGGKRLFDRLLVADVCKHVMKNRDA